MRPYRHNGPCPKCGFTIDQDANGLVLRAISTSYMWPQKVPTGEGTFDMTSEHLVRRCGRCHYEWAEACVDESTTPDTRPAALRGMEQGLRDIQEQKAKGQP